jgi:hypothetical protein
VWVDVGLVGGESVEERHGARRVGVNDACIKGEQKSFPRFSNLFLTPFFIFYVNVMDVFWIFLLVAKIHDNHWIFPQ